MNINFFMKKAIDQALKGLKAGEVPIGGILIDNKSQNIIAEAYNRINLNRNATAHAEILIINQGCELKKSKYLNETSLFINLEPCAMCAAAISEVHIKRVYFGAYNEEKGCLESIMKIYNKNNFFVPEVYGGILENECSAILKKFFINQRK